MKALAGAFIKALDIDGAYQSGLFWTITQVLVEIDLLIGLAENMEIKANGNSYSQLLDYECIPYRCARCHLHGHVGKGTSLVPKLGRKMKYWDYLSLDAKGQPGGLITGWKSLVSLLNSDLLVSRIWTNFLCKDLGQDNMCNKFLCPVW